MLSDSTDVCLSVLSVTLVYCGQTAGWIKMKLGTEIGLGSGHIVLDGDPTPPTKRGNSPQFSAHVRCGQTAGWIKMPLGMEVGLGQGDIVLDCDPVPTKRGTLRQHGLFVCTTLQQLTRFQTCHVTVSGLKMGHFAMGGYL